ncbi:unnamed protein product [Phytophthora lilii]|uniref:Unnamed protein product n=1 Tax=Phytophthora lilii TaxID=2077276 RepID=A0A9W6TF69_9STRA|nr:unnamed protein product [Phytophthora lilii]
MEHCAAERSQSLILLKSKLRASGRSQSKSNHRIAAALDDSASNQQEEEDKSKDEFVPRISDFLASRRGQHRLQPKQSPALLPEFEAAQDVEEPAAAPSATFECGNQSVAELKQEFAELSGKIKQLDVHVRQPDELVAHARVTPTPSFPMKLKSYTKKVIQWQCDTCERECIPVREESRCLWCVLLQ